MDLKNIDKIAKQLNVNNEAKSIKEEVVFKFKQLDLYDKRNEFNSEFIRLYEMLKIMVQIQGKDIDCQNLKNYDVSDKMCESEYLDSQYSNLLDLREIIIEFVTSNQ